jgi:LasA protease
MIYKQVFVKRMASQFHRFREGDKRSFIIPTAMTVLSLLLCGCYAIAMRAELLALTPTATSALAIASPQAPALTTQPLVEVTSPTATIPTQLEVASTSFASAPLSGQLLSTADEYLYTTQAGDTLAALAARFGVPIEAIRAQVPLRTPGLLNPGISVRIPYLLGELPWSQPLLPDSEVIDSPASANFDAVAYANQASGYLASYRHSLSQGLDSGGAVVALVARENAINPRLLLALLEYECHCVLEQPPATFNQEYPLELETPYGLYHQLVWLAEQLSNGYYGWRSGTLTELDLPGGGKIRLAPHLNAGTVALMYTFARLELAKNGSQEGWEARLHSESGLVALYRRMFGDPWQRAAAVEPLFPPDLVQPPLQFPFLRNVIWSYTGGPHWAWERSGPLAAVDFAPRSVRSGCVPSNEWVAAAAPGLIVRVQPDYIAQDLDGDGLEQTGWVLIYLHVDSQGIVKAGDYLAAGDPIGHPTCTGGPATGTHLHFVRKYNGEWIAARDSVPFILDGWTVRAGDQPYQGTLTQGSLIVTASPLSPSSSWILRPAGD